MRLQVLGGARLDGPLAPDLGLWLCVVLAVRDAPLAREQLAALLWPEASPLSAHNRLRQLLHRTRRSRLAEGLRGDAGSLSWRGDSDLATFRAALAAGRWDEAALAYAGPLLDGLPLPESEALADWLEAERGRLHDQYLQALARAAEAHETAGRPVRAAERLETLLAQDALHEEAVSALMRCQEALGNPARALSVFERYRRELEEAFGVEPSPALGAQAQRLRRHDPARAAGSLRGAPPLFTRFLGRERELQLAAARLADPGCRWLSLTGPGGVGKTRLALELGTRLAQGFADGATFVQLAGVDGPHLAQTVIRALGGELQGGHDPDEQLRALLAGQHLLLVLDNFEHLQAQAARLPGWLAAVPGLTLLVTSRHRLEFQAEWTLRLDTLPVEPEHDDPLSSPSAHLFAERAGRADVGFEPQRHAADILRVCRRCEGLPLAIELAAAWVGQLSPAELAGALERDQRVLTAALHDQEGRHRSLRLVFEHAWALLPPSLRTVYAALAVFRTPFGAEDAARVAGATAEDLRELERRSLLAPVGEGRYGWHQNLRVYAWEALDPDARTAVQVRHLEHFLALARDTAPEMKGPRQAEAHARLAAVHDDLRAALALAEGQARWAQGLELALGLHWFWYVRGHHAEGLQWLDTFLAQFDEPGSVPPLMLARALKAGGSLASERGEYSLARARFERALALARSLGDRRTETETLHVLGVLERDTGGLAAAGTYLEAARVLGEELGDPVLLGATLNDLGILAAQQGDRAGARVLIGRSLQLKEQAGDRQGVAYALGNLGVLCDDLHEELRHYQQSLVIKRELDDLQGIAKTTFNCGVVATELGELELARQHFDDALSLHLRLGKYLHLSHFMVELAGWLHLAGDDATALALATFGLALPRYTGVPVPAGTQARLLDWQGRLAGQAGADTQVAAGEALTPVRALELALQAVRAADLSRSVSA